MHNKERKIGRTARLQLIMLLHSIWNFIYKFHYPRSFFFCPGWYIRTHISHFLRNALYRGRLRANNTKERSWKWFHLKARTRDQGIYPRPAGKIVPALGRISYKSSILGSWKVMKDRGELQKCSIDNATAESILREKPQGYHRPWTCMDRITVRWRANGKQEMSMNEDIFARIWPLSGRITIAAVQERKGWAWPFEEESARAEGKRVGRRYALL